MTAPARWTVLLVEDDAAVRQFVGMALEDEPLDVHSCATLAEARRWLLQATRPPDVLLLDLMLPDGTGTELLEDPAMRQLLDGCACVLFSAGRAAAVQSQAERLVHWGVRAVLEKPVTLGRLLGAVRQACEAGRQTGAATVGLAPDATGPAEPTAATQPPPIDGSDAAMAAAVQAYFEGQQTLFDQMRAISGPLLQGDLRDLRAQQQALLAQWPSVPDAIWAESRRLAHSMKSALAMMGCPAAAAAARRAENAAAEQDPKAFSAACEELSAGAGRWPGA